MPWNILSSAIGAGASIINTKQVNETNMRMQRETNKNNRDLVRMQNEAAAAESEKAYDRSKASNQVNLMRQAGMSRAGAINALNGGGSYTPAPVNTAQDTAPQMQTTDFSGLSNLAQIALQNKQLKQQERMQDKQLKAQADESKKQREHDLLMKDIDSANQVQHDYLDYEKHSELLDFDKYVYDNAAPLRQKQLEELDARIAGLKATTTQTKVQNEILGLQKELQKDSLDYEKLRIRSEALTSSAQGELDRLIIAQKRGALLEMDTEELRSFMQYKLRLELASMIGGAIKDKQWNESNLEGKLKVLKFIDDFLVGVKK